MQHGGAHTCPYFTVHMLARQLTKAHTPLVQFVVDFLYGAKTDIYDCLADVSNLFAVYKVYS